MNSTFTSNPGFFCQKKHKKRAAPASGTTLFYRPGQFCLAKTGKTAPLQLISEKAFHGIWAAASTGHPPEFPACPHGSGSARKTALSPGCSRQ